MVFPISQDEIDKMLARESEDVLFGSNLSDERKDQLFLKKLKTVVTVNSPSSQQNFSRALEAVAIMIMYPDSFSSIPELKSIFDKKKISPPDIRIMTEWVYQHPAFIDEIPKRYDENVNKLRADPQHTSARHQMLRIFIPLCLSQMTNIHDVGRMFNRGEMGVDKLTTSHSLVQHFSSLENRIATCDHQDKNALETTIFLFTRETLMMLLEDFRACFPDPDTFKNDCQRMEDFPAHTNVVRKRNELICHLMSIQLSSLMNEFTEKKTMSAKFCAVVAEKAGFFLTNAVKTLDQTDFYHSFEQELKNLFSSAASTPYSHLGLNLDGDGNQSTFSSVALEATNNQLDVQHASETLTNILTLRGAIPEPLLIESITTLWVTAAYNFGIKRADGTTQKTDHHFTDSLVKDILEHGSDFLQTIFSAALLKATKDRKPEGQVGNIISVVFRVIDEQKNPKLRQELIDIVSDFRSNPSFQSSKNNLKNVVDTALLSAYKPTENGSLSFFKQILTAAAAEGNNNELVRIAKLLPQTGDYKSRFLTALDDDEKNVAGLKNDWMGGYLEELLDKQPDLDPNEKASMQAILTSDLAIADRLKILSLIAVEKIKKSPSATAINNFYSALSKFEIVTDSNVEDRFKRFIEVLQKNTAYDQDKFKLNFQHRILRESNHEAKNFEAQFTRWVNFSNDSKYVVATEDLTSISARPTPQEVEQCAKKIQEIHSKEKSISREPSVHERSPSQSSTPSERATAMEQALYKTVIADPKITVQRRGNIASQDTATINPLHDDQSAASSIAPQRGAIVSQGAANITQSKEAQTYDPVLQDQNGDTSAFTDKVLLGQLKIALQQFTAFYIKSYFFGANASPPDGIQKAIKMIDGTLRKSDMTMPGRIQLVLKQLKEIAESKVMDNYSTWAGWGGLRSAETQAAYQAINNTLGDAPSSSENDNINRETLSALITKLNAVHAKHQNPQKNKEAAKRIDLDLAARIDMRS